MQQLTNAEEQLMEQLWKLRKLYERFTSDFSAKTKKRQRLPLLLKRMIDKDFRPILSLVTPENTIHW
jgi:hypothetical protein